MTQDRWKKIEELFQAARERGTEVLSGVDAELRREVEQLLAAGDKRADLLDITNMLATGPAASNSNVPGLPWEIGPFRRADAVGADSVSGAETSRVGQRIGPYELTAMVGTGGMGEVYRATDARLKRQVAIKVLPAAMALDPHRLSRFKREAEMLAALNHSHIAALYGLEEVGDSVALVMEYVDGATLAERIAGGPLPLTDALAIGRQIAEAFESAHEQGIVHRDLKPANVKVRPDGTVKVLDFGLAKALDRTPVSGGPEASTLSSPLLSSQGLILGTPAYMSPEQAKGGPVDKRTDIWAFGCVLFEMLTGQGAFRAEDVASTLARVLEGDPNWKALPAGVPPAVRRTLELCLRKDPRNRLRDFGDVRLALESEFVTPMPTAVPSWRLGVAVGAVVLGVLVTILYFMNRREPAIPARPLSVTRFVITPQATATLASLGGLDLAISADGKRIAYFAREADGRVVLYVRDLDGLDARRVPGTEILETGPGNMNPFFSADGTSIGLLVPGRGVMGVPLDGTAAVRMLDPPRPGFIGATWTAENTLLYSSGTRLQRVSTGGGGVPQPLTADTPNRFVAAPVLLPGGRAVIFHVFGGGADRVAVIDLETNEEKTLIEGASNPTYLDTGHLVFVRGDTLMAVPFSVADLALTGDAVALVQGIRHPGGGAADYAIARNGTLAYVPASNENEITATAVWVDRLGRVVGRVLNDSVINPRDPRLSPDGKRLLLVTGLMGDGDLWSYDVGGRPALPLALTNDTNSPVWSPDGSQVAFSITLNSPILTLPADGSVSAPRALTVRGQPQVWSGADELIFLWPAMVSDILASPVAAAGNARGIVTSEYSEFQPALSPDERWLAYVSNRTGQNEIWVQRYPEGVPVRVSSTGGTEPLWSADGREIFYRQDTTLMAITVQAGQEFTFTPPQRLFSMPYRAANVFRSYTVAPAGRFLAFQAVDERRAAGSIVVVQNFSEEVKQRVHPRQPQ
jgi:serine/threonine-protein kinase